VGKKSFNQLVLDIQGWTEERAKLAIREISDLLKTKMHDNITLTDHSLRELKVLDHPYAASNPSNPHNPPYLVHKQDGDLASAMYSKIVETPTKKTAICGIDEQAAPHVAHVVFGTSRMVPRDFIRGTLDEIKPGIDKIMADSMGVTKK